MRGFPSLFAGLLVAAAVATPALAAPSIGDATVISGTGTADITDTPVVAASSHGGWASSYLFYNFDLYNLTLPSLPPGAPPTDIPMLITFGGYLAGADSGYYSATAQISVGSYGTSFTCSNTDSSGCGSFSLTNQPFNFSAYPHLAGGPLSGTIFLSVIAKNEHGSGSASAYLDPVISFAPAFLAANPLAVVSYGAVTPVSVASAPAVPEPAVWMSMIAGLGMVGGVAWRRRKGAVSQA